jgi:NAD(P)-dependent dehydrogenase (short-subunit alcohol dehydrogenase family)
MSDRDHMDVHGSALVTWASRGIGRAVALELANRGFDTIAAMRAPESGAALPGETDGHLRVARLDVTDPSTFAFHPICVCWSTTRASTRPTSPWSTPTSVTGVVCSKRTCSGRLR